MNDFLFTELVREHHARLTREADSERLRRAAEGEHATTRRRGLRRRRSIT